MYKFAELVLVMLVVSFVRLSEGLGHRTESTEVLSTEVGQVFVHVWQHTS